MKEPPVFDKMPIWHRREIIRAILEDPNYMTVADLLGRSQTDALAGARRRCWWRLRNDPDLGGVQKSFSRIARVWKRDHSTIIHACARVEADPNLLTPTAVIYPAAYRNRSNTLLRSHYHQELRETYPGLISLIDGEPTP
jgi:hypothetical protein